ncbi:MAG: hypothetical protein EBT80_05170 [Chitinophagales bacterium]|jgi:hypothetical protein|nr:hypothetical protein [Chitinophagales bacterium]
MKIKFIILLAVIAMGASFVVPLTGCGVYRFSDASVPDSIKTIKVNFIENKASYVNPQLSPRLTDRLRQKIIAQTRLTQTNRDNADWEITATITQYNFSTSAIAGQQASNNRLTVGVQIVLFDRTSDETRRYEVSRSFEFKGTLSFQAAEASLGDEMTRTLTDDIFNKLFSNW